MFKQAYLPFGDAFQPGSEAKIIFGIFETGAFEVREAVKAISLFALNFSVKMEPGT